MPLINIADPLLGNRSDQEETHKQRDNVADKNRLVHLPGKILKNVLLTAIPLLHHQNFYKYMLVDVVAIYFYCKLN